MRTATVRTKGGKKTARSKKPALAKSKAAALNLAALEKQIAALVRTGDLEGLKELHAKAQGAEAYVRSRWPEHEAGLNAQAHAARAVLLVERGIGGALTARPKADNLKKGAARATKLAVRETLKDLGITDQQSARWKRLHKLPVDVFNARVDAIIAKGRRATTHGALQESASEGPKYDGDEHYSPREFMALVREALGGRIELDPASCLVAQETIAAEIFYTKQDDGLSKEWRGSTYLNPPYSKPAPWIEKLLDALASGNVPEALVLVNNTTDPEWAQSLLESSSAVCFLKKRIAFDRADKKANKGTRQGQIAYYLGNDPGSFVELFEEHGAILRPEAPLHVPSEAHDEDEEKQPAGEWFDEPAASAE